MLLNHPDFEVWIDTLVEQPHHRSIFADFLEDNGFNELAWGERWLAQNDKYPDFGGWWHTGYGIDHATLPSWLNEIEFEAISIYNSPVKSRIIYFATRYRAEKGILLLFDAILVNYTRLEDYFAQYEPVVQKLPTQTWSSSQPSVQNISRRSRH